MADQITNYQCPACTGPLHFVGASGRLECDYCGSSYSVDEIEALYQRKDAQAAAETAAADEAAASPDGDEGTWTAPEGGDWAEDGMQSYTCPSCGAELVCDASTAATSCPYCGNPSIVPGRLSGAQKPDYIIPFRLSKADAVAALKKHYQKKPLLPKAFSAQNHIEQIQGVYVPFWLFSGSAEGDVTYKCTRSMTRREGDYDVTDTQHYLVRRAGSVTFEKIPVDASSKMPDENMDSIEPFDYQALKPFSNAYLPGFLADQYDVSVEESASRADTRCKASCESALRSTVTGYTTCTPETQTRPHPPRSGAVRAAAGLDAAYEVEGQGLPVLHERANRQADGRPAHLVGPVLGVLRRDRGRPRRCAVRAAVRAVRRDPG